MVAGPLSGRLADRIGPRTPLVIGLLAGHGRASPGSRGSRSTRASRFLVVPFILLGLGMGFTMSPMSTAAMNAVDRTKAGVASGHAVMTRMVGGTFGVAALGALVAAVGRHDLAQSLPQRARGRRASSSSTRSARGAATNGAPGAGRAPRASRRSSTRSAPA